MLISKVSEGCEEGRATEGGGEYDAEYHTANELFELMSKNVHYDSNNEDSLTAQDIVLLYKNIDVGTQLMNDATEATRKKPNQYVETIVYNDELDSDSDASEIYSVEDIQNVFTVNQERMDFLNGTSFENLLCHKFGDIQINSFNLPSDFDKNFLFKDPYIKNQLTNLNGMTSSSEYDSLFSTSLIDYICCKRLEDNYNFYMDNIIRYVQRTIEQLKRISNGDYLTDRAKEKWREVNSNNQERENNTKVLATSTSIPLHVECKQAGLVSWDDIVHSEVDIRSLSKILEKKIVVEIPKLICGSYRLYSRQCADNLIISCQKEQQEIEENAKESRVDVVLQLQRSQSGQVMSNINSIMILRTSPALPDIRAAELLPLEYKVENEVHSIEEADSKETKVTVIELNENTDVHFTECETECSNVKEIEKQNDEDDIVSQNGSSVEETNDYPFSDRNESFASNLQSSESSIAFRDAMDKPFFPSANDEPTYIIKSTDELRMSMLRLHKTASVLEESGEEVTAYASPKRRSPVRVRIKSPYENKSFLMEEKKRKRLLEIRERREKKKIALSENCKISKHKYGKVTITPRASNSVTKLSISNKSFYNSIYGQRANLEDKFKTHQTQKNNTLTPEASSKQDTQKEYSDTPILTIKKNNKKYINKSYYLDDTETEMMHMQTEVENETENAQTECSASNSYVSNELHVTVDLLKQLIEPSHTNLKSNKTCHVDAQSNSFDDVSNSCEDSLVGFNIPDITVPANIDAEAKVTSKKNSTSYECRKSIDKLYNLIKKFEKPKSPEIRKVVPNVETSCEARGDSIIQGNESSTSVTNNTPSNHSCCSVEKHTTPKPKTKKQVTIMPKVILSPKLQSPRIQLDKTKKERKSILSSHYKGPPSDNPLKAISQLLHEFDNVQKTRQKKSPEARTPKKPVVHNDVKSNSRQNSYRRRSRLEQHLKNEQEPRASPVHQTFATPKEKAKKPTESVRKLPSPVDRNVDKPPKKRITDMIDEAKEARGEAVRGPSKFSSRLDSLAQPKKCYVMAHHEEYQNRYGRNMVSARLQRLAAPATAARAAGRRPTAPVATVAAVKLPPALPPQLDKGERAAKRSLRSTSSSPVSVARQATASHKPSYIHTPDSQETIGTKTTTTIETCVQSYSRIPPPPALLAGLRSRIPLLPRDFDLDSSASSSCVEARSLGAALRRLVGAAAGGAPSTLTTSPLLDEDEGIPGEDVTAEDVSTEDAPSRGALDLKVLESALHTQITGAFSKRLRITNSALTSKHSMQQIFFLQSEDASSVLVKSVSNLKLSARDAASLLELKAPRVADGPNLNCKVMTVGYVFPEYQEFQKRSTSKVKILEIPPMVDSGSREFSTQCFKGRPEKTRADGAAQANDVDDVIVETLAIPVEHFGTQVTNSELLVETEPIEINTPTKDRLGTVRVEYIDSKGDGLTSVEEVIIEDVRDVKEETEVASESNALPAADYTSSLDLLVGILNEIQKIARQDQMAANGTKQNHAETSPNDVADSKIEDGNGTRDLVSITSLDNMRQLESSTSIYSFYLSSDTNASESIEKEESHTVPEKVTEFVDKSTDTQLLCANVSHQCLIKNAVTEVAKLACVDKEVSANIASENYVDNSTDVPSRLLPVAIDRGVNESNCALQSLTPCTQSIVPIASYQTLYSNRMFRAATVKKIIELPRIDAKHERINVPRDEISNEKRFGGNFSSANVMGVNNERSLVRSEFKKYCVNVKEIDLDPMLKIKRDVLVTVYSILVLTVFAALSFPELLMFRS